MLRKARSQPSGPCVPGVMLSPHVPACVATCPLLWAAALAAQPCGVSLGTRGIAPDVYGTTASPLCLELRSFSAWHATHSWAVHQLAWRWLLPWLRVTLPWSQAQPSSTRTSGPGVLPLPVARRIGWVPRVASFCGERCLVPCARGSLDGLACAVSMAPWPSFTGGALCACVFGVSV